MRRLTLGLVIALGLAATAPLPAQGQPAKPIPDFQAIAGEWQSELTLRDGNKGPATWIIRDNGQFESRTPRGTNTGTMQVKDGKVLFKYDSGTGSTGSFTLHESPDKQPWLHGRTDGTGTIWYLWRPGAGGDAPPPAPAQPPTVEAFRGRWSGTWVSGREYGTVEAEIGSLTSEKAWIFGKVAWVGGGTPVVLVLDLKKGELASVSPGFEITLSLKGDQELSGDYYYRANNARGTWTLKRK